MTGEIKVTGQCAVMIIGSTLLQGGSRPGGSEHHIVTVQDTQLEGCMHWPVVQVSCLTHTLQSGSPSSWPFVKPSPSESFWHRATVQALPAAAKSCDIAAAGC